MKHHILPILFLAALSCTRPATPPNIVLIMSDDQGYGDFGFTGNPYISTPNLDQLKHEAVYFDRFYVSPVCAPTRASLLTGRYHLRTGTSWVTHGKEIMRPEERTIAESLSDHGYATGCFGKWHNGEHYPQNPNGQGFDTFFGFCAGHWNNYFDPRMEYNGVEVHTKGYITDILTDSALQFIQQNREQPFFCYVPYNAPHGPFQVPDRYFDKYKRMGLNDKDAAVYGMCENIDENVGRILAKLDELGLEENTIVLYLTDNGPNGHRYNAGMKGIKAHVDEGGVRTPLLMRYPGVLPAGDTIRGIASHIDLLPTLHGLAGLTFTPKFPLDGIDLSSYLASGMEIPDRQIFTHQVHREVRPTPASVRTPQYRLVVKNGEPELYDMLADPGQHTDIAREMPVITAALADTLAKWFKVVSQGVPYNPPVPVGYEAAPWVVLTAPEATLAGNIQFKGEMGWANDWLIGFGPGNGSATWDIDVIQPGVYALSALIACDTPSNGDIITVHCGGQVVDLQLESPYDAPKTEVYDRVPRTEVYERTWPEIPLGTLQLEKGPGKVVLSFSGSADTRLEIRELRLKRR